MKTGAELIRLERVRQITSEGYDATHDDKHTRGQLAENACHLIVADLNCWLEDVSPSWGIEFNKKTNIERLAAAGALIAAEIDRLQRIKNK